MRAPNLAETPMQFYNNGRAELDKSIWGDQMAKTALLVGMATCSNVVFFGRAGGGKTELAHDAYRLVSDIDETDLATIPPQHDLSARQIVGGEVPTRKLIETDEGKREETSLITVDGLIRPETKLIRADDITRGNPAALQSLLPVMENRRLETTAGTLEMPDLVAVVATMNPLRPGQNNYSLGDAIASRFNVGTPVGDVLLSDAEARTRVRQVRKLRRTSSPRDIRPVVSLDGLKDIRQQIDEATLPESVEDRVDEVSINATRQLVEARVELDSARLTLQIEKVAKALGLMRNEHKVARRDDVDMAAELVAGAKYGAVKQLHVKEYREFMTRVLAA